MADLFPHLLWAGVAWYAITRAADVISWFAPSGAATPSAIPAPVEVPDDLVALAMGEQEVWAQEEVLRVIRERYETYHDWNKVRAAMGLGRRD